MKKCIYFFLTIIFETEMFCEISGEEGKWLLKVNDKEFYVKGIGCGIHKIQGIDYLKLAKELGANTVRTWGIDQTTAEYLDTANKYGLKVIVGIWLDYATNDNGIDYYNIDYKKEVEKKILSYIEQFKNHPAILMWCIGNECIHFTTQKTQKIAISKFLNELIKRVHKVDKNHPVTYASAGTNDLPYLKQYVPEIDVIGMNIYDSIQNGHSQFIMLKFNKPYLITEYGPPGWWMVKKDLHKSIEPNDEIKSVWYRDHTRTIFRLKGYNIGGVAFHLGETTQESLTWWNINYKEYKKLSFWMLHHLFTKNELKKTPYIKKVIIKNKTVKPLEKFNVELDVFHPLGKQISNNYKFDCLLSTSKEGVLQYFVNDEIKTEWKQIDRFKFSIKAPENEGIYRVYIVMFTDNGSVSVNNTCIEVANE